MDTKALRQKILDLAIRGKLVPQDPNDEPASVLLERIRAEKERLIAEGKIKRPKKSKSSSSESHYQNFIPPFPIPDSWQWVRLQDCCHIAGRIGFRGYTKDDLVSEDDGVITLSPSNIVDGVMDYSKCTYISWHKYDESPEIKVYEGDILLVKTGSSYGKCALVSHLPKEATINPQFVVIKNISINPEYLTCVLQSEYARRLYEGFVLGTAIPTFTQEKLGNMLLPLPPIGEQKGIVAIINEFNFHISNIDNQKEELRGSITLSKSKILGLAMQGKLVPQDPEDEPAADMLRRVNPNARIITDNPHYPQLPDNWVYVRLSDVAALLSGRDMASESCNIKNKGVPYLIGASNITKGTFSFNRWTTQPQVISKKDDILISCKGTIGELLKNTYGDIHIARQFMAIRNYECIRPDFMQYAILNNLTSIRKKANGIIPGISRPIILELTIPLPPMNEQDIIILRIKESESLLDSIEHILN